MNPVRLIKTLLMLIVLIIILSCISLSFGTVYISPPDVLKSFINGSLHTGSKGSLYDVIFLIRLPRILLAIVVGGALAGAGSIFQSLIRNPLGDPYLMGVSSGAACGMVLSAHLGFSGLLLGLPVASIIGGLIALFVVYVLARAGGKIHPVRLILAGIVVSAFLSAVAMFILSRSASMTVRGIVFWMMGDLGNQDLSRSLLLLLFLVLGLLPVIILSGRLNVIMIGDDIASQLGIAVERVKAISLITASFLTGIAVAAAGVIGFVGLVVPNLVRMAWGSDFRKNLPISVLAGALLLLISDTIVRIISPVSEIPVGIITAFIGAPFFIHLLIKERT